MPRHEIPTALLATEADTLGWDAVNAIRLPQVNEAMLESDASPAAFDTTVQEGWTLDGTFGPWQLTRGGSGAIVFLRTPIPSAHMTFPDTPDLDLTDGRATVAIKLQYLPQPPAGPATPATDGDEGGTKQFLARDAKARSEDDPAVVIQSIDYGSSTPSELQKALFQAALANWFNDNLAAFTYVFSVVNLNARAAKEDFQWLKPTYTSYAYFNGASDEESYFGVLNLTQGDSPDGLTNQIPPSAIPSGCQGSILISNNLFLREMILPGLTKSFTGATESDFDLNSTGTVIENRDTITLDDIRIGAVDYTPELHTFRLQIVGDEIQIDTKTKVHVSPGIDAFVTATEFYRIVLVDKPDGSQTLDFARSRDPLRNHWMETATWVTVTEVIVGIVGAIAATVAGNVIATVARRIIAVIIIIVVAGILAAIPAIIAAVMEGKAADALPSIGDLVMEASSDVTWPGSSGFTLKSAELNGSFQLGGDLTPVTRPAGS
ncbi:TULIP family P47-like protein [Myceligenerans salitolerans]|uniref:TULIP family P47-like protein n=1 Tax=Myceligenerans salitolerans TaxID=1230528 RepID=A0ABS3IBC8_9MICO|nr:TULIP family P47-like protein [Myceligenerans salitolerans]MBO0610347.1 TULIP family P47-like protein [Myceligenerans salitolerans]